MTKPKTKETKQASENSGVQLPAKLSAKAVCGNIKKTVVEALKAGKLENGDTVKLFRIMGIARSVITGTGDNGDWVAFKGDFQAIRSTDGQVFRSGKCFLPASASDLIEGAAPAKDNEISFAFEIGIEVDETANTLYVYTVNSPKPPEENDALKLLAESFGE